MAKGIYKIENIWDGKVYIGESNNIEERWIKHKEDLNNNKHHSKQLQKDWNEYADKNNFEFKIIETIDDTLHPMIQQGLLYIYEDKYIKQYDSINNGYNTENTLVEVMEGRKSLFNQPLDKPNKFAKGVINNILKNIEKNNGVYIPSEKSKRLNKKLESEPTKEIKPKKNKLGVNEDNIIRIINDCMNYEFQEEFETMASVFRNNKINCSKAYQILVGLKILYKDKNGKYMPTANYDRNMFQRRTHSYCDKDTAEIKNYQVTYINKKGFEYLLHILLNECKNNNINIFHKKYLEEINNNILHCE